LVVAGKIEKSYASLEIYVYEQENNNLFVHHEIMLSSFPLALEWLNTELGSIGSGNPGKGNYAIVSSFLPEI
jgi:periodic tryptophan protein 1